MLIILLASHILDLQLPQILLIKVQGIWCIKCSIRQFWVALSDNMEAQDSVVRKEEKCEKCKKLINMWDRKARACDKVYHRSCLTCSHCHNLLDPATVTDPHSPLLCKAWYTRCNLKTKRNSTFKIWIF